MLYYIVSNILYKYLIGFTSIIFTYSNTNYYIFIEYFYFFDLRYVIMRVFQVGITDLVISKSPYNMNYKKDTPHFSMIFVTCKYFQRFKRLLDQPL